MVPKASKATHNLNLTICGRKQLGMNFGSGSPYYRGLTLDEIQTLDFSKMDISEFINELMIKFTGTYKTPHPEEI